MTALEQGPEMQQEVLVQQIDTEIQKAPEIPQDRKMIFDSLSKYREVALAGLLTAAIVLAGSKEAQAEPYHHETQAEAQFDIDRPSNIIQSPEQILEKFKQGSGNEVYELGAQLLSLEKTRAAEETGSEKYGEEGRKIIKQLSRMMLFCHNHGIDDLNSLYNLSKVDKSLLEAAQKDYEENLALSQGKHQSQKPVAQGGFERTTKQSETLKRTGR